MEANSFQMDSHTEAPMVFRSVWISDIHLGTKHARVAELLDFLRTVDCKYLYIVGDFIDGWELKYRWFWRDDYNLLIQKLLRKSRRQTQVTGPVPRQRQTSLLHWPRCSKRPDQRITAVINAQAQQPRTGKSDRKRKTDRDRIRRPGSIGKAQRGGEETACAEQAPHWTSIVKHIGRS